MRRIGKTDLQTIPGIGKSITEDLCNIGIRSIKDLKGKDPEKLYNKSNRFEGEVQDRCLLYTYRYAVYFAEHKKLDPKKSRWWHWKDKTKKLKADNKNRK
jgi:nucleotidyltransferase/DNA polymerase involved in DNA repair